MGAPLNSGFFLQRRFAHARVFNTDDRRAFLALLRSCTKNKDLDRGIRAHDEIVTKGLLIECSDALVTMYAKCGAVEKAKALFDIHKGKDLLTWTALIAGYAQKGHGQDALNCFEKMQQEGISPDAVTFTCILKACGNIKAAKKGEEIHEQVSKLGLLKENVVLGNALVDMYAKCGALTKARSVLEELPVRDVISWNALIAGYAQQCNGEEALNCFEGMRQEGLCPDAVTFTCVLKACGSIGAAGKGEEIHIDIAKQGLLGRDAVLRNALVDMYLKSGALARARQVLEELHVRDIIFWTVLISQYVKRGEGAQALSCFDWTQQEAIMPNEVMFIWALKACATIKAADKGRQIHDQISKCGFLGTNLLLGTALVDMYAKCGALIKARQVLDELPVRNVISWNSFISGYCQQGEGEQALKCFEGMLREGLSPDQVSFTCILKACGIMKALDKGQKFHHEIAKQGLLRHDVKVGNALIDMYVKCGALTKAQRVLEELPVRDVISWSSLIAGYAQQGEGEQALNCFDGMRREGLSPDAVTFSCLLKACGSIGATEKGEKLHDEIAKQGLLRSDIVLGTTVVDMYVKCGALSKAQRVLEELSLRDVISWNALIAGYARQCKFRQAMDCFKRMQCEGLSPDAGTFSCVLSACSRVSLVEDAQALFLNMSTKYGVEPELAHFNCVIDLFGRAGNLGKAVEIIENSPSPINGVWFSFLGACQKWGDVNVGRWAFEHAVQVDEDDAVIYIMMANIYAAAGMQDDAHKIEAMRIKNKACWIKPGQEVAPTCW